MRFMHVLFPSFTTVVWIWSFSVSCFGQDTSTPSSHNGPSESTYETAFSWSNYQLAAFVDLNADRQMDVILVDPDGTRLYASVAPDSQSSVQFGQVSGSSSNLPFPKLLLSPGLVDPIRSVVPADFNGDSIVDLLILTFSETLSVYTAYIAYGATGDQRGSFVLNKQSSIAVFTSQPLVCDLNSDGIADIYGQTSLNSRFVILGGKQLLPYEQPYSGLPWSPSGYSAFGDVNGDTVPDILILVGSTGPKIQLILRDMSFPNGLPANPNMKLISLPRELLGAAHLTLGLFSLTDFDNDGYIELLLPACTAASCNNASFLFLYSFRRDEWTSVDIDWFPVGVSPGYSWSLASAPAGGLSVSSLVGPAVGDVDLDGKPDIGLSLAYWSSANTPKGSLPAVLLNQGLDPTTKKLRFRAYLLPGGRLPDGDSEVRQTSFFYNRERASPIFMLSYAVIIWWYKLPVFFL